MKEHDANNELHTQIQYRLIEKLTESERRYRELLESLREIVFECDRNGCLIFLNNAWTEILGYSTQTSLGKRLDVFVLEEDKKTWQVACQEKIGNNLELRFIHQAGVVLWLELAIRFTQNSSFTGSLTDITQRKQVEFLLKQAKKDLETKVRSRTHELSQTNKRLSNTLMQLQQTQGWLIQQEKMSSLGQLVAGVAHEINNPISFIHGNLDYIQTYTEDLIHLLRKYQQYCPHPSTDIQTTSEKIDLGFIFQDLPKVIASMQMGSDRICEIVASLRNFSRLDEADIKAVNIHDGLENTLTILNHRLKASPQRAAIQVIKDYDQNIPLVECYAGALNQVFMNLLANAIDSMDEVDEVMQSDNFSASEEPLRQITIKTILIDQQWARISIADTGAGIPVNIQQQIFNPFFTTKPVGQGTGMGLAISYQIVTDQHGGNLACFSLPDKGTEFVIQIPIQQAVVAANMPLQLFQHSLEVC